jgi:predicted transcriptional regulator
MNKIAENILDRIADWPEEAQAELAKAISDIEVKHLGTYQLSDEERKAVQEGLAQAERGEFIPDHVVAAYFNKYRA